MMPLWNVESWNPFNHGGKDLLVINPGQTMDPIRTSQRFRQTQCQEALLLVASFRWWRNVWSNNQAFFYLLLHHPPKQLDSNSISEMWHDAWHLWAVQLRPGRKWGAYPWHVHLGATPLHSMQGSWAKMFRQLMWIVSFVPWHTILLPSSFCRVTQQSLGCMTVQCFWCPPLSAAPRGKQQRWLNLYRWDCKVRVLRTFISPASAEARENIGDMPEHLRSSRWQDRRESNAPRACRRSCTSSGYRYHRQSPRAVKWSPGRAS